MIFCTLFNRLYLPKGIALYRSLERTAGQGFVLYVLCMDEFSADALQRFDFPNLRVIRLHEIEDDELKAARSGRGIGEYCWTCTAPLILYVQDRHPPGKVVTYVDADIRFFSDPSAILAELGDRSIFIHEHDFAPGHAHLRAGAGRFNVGVAAFRNDEEGRACLQRWKAQCLAECVLDSAAGKCGDQHYLDEWPSRYGGLVISKNPGVGRAPWNIMKHRVQVGPPAVTVDGQPLVFYHYHALRVLRPRFGLKPTIMAQWYFFSNDVVRAIYHPYERELWRALNDLRSFKFSLIKELPTVSSNVVQSANSQLLLSFHGLFIPTEQVMKSFSGVKRLVKSVYGMKRLVRSRYGVKRDRAKL
jgi:hypothetical protein